MRERTEISEKYKWNTSDIFSSIDIWKVELSDVNTKLDKFVEFKGVLNSHEQLIECLNMKDEVNKRLGLLYLYIHIRADEDLRLGENQALLAEVIKLEAKYNSATSFISVELLEIGSESLESLANEEGLQIYKHFFDNILRNKEHTLEAKEENIIAKLSELDYSSSNIFNILNNTNIIFEYAEDEHGKIHQLTKGNYIVYLESHDQVLRKNTFNNVHKEYAKLKDTLAQIYIENLRKDRIAAEIRNYNSVLEMKLSEDNIPTMVYDDILKVVGGNLKPLHKLVEIRKKVLNLDKLYMYDMYVPLVT